MLPCEFLHFNLFSMATQTLYVGADKTPVGVNKTYLTLADAKNYGGGCIGTITKKVGKDEIDPLTPEELSELGTPVVSIPVLNPVVTIVSSPSITALTDYSTKTDEELKVIAKEKGIRGAHLYGREKLIAKLAL